MFCPMPFERQAMFAAYLQRFASTGRASDRKIAEPGGGKRVRRVRPDRLVNKNCSFIWEFTGRSLKTGHFSPVFGVFGPLRLTSRLCRRPPAPPLFPCTGRPFLKKNGVSPRKFAGFRNPGSAHPLELFFFFFSFFFCLSVTASERLCVPQERGRI